MAKKLGSNRLANFKHLKEYKNKVLQKLIENENIAKAVGNNSANFLSVEIDDPYDLLYKNIYPYTHVPETNEEEKTFITISFRDFRYVNRKFVAGRIKFNVFTHLKGLMRTNEGLRTDFIISEICEMFNESNEFGIGKLQFDIMDEYYVDTKFSGHYIQFINVDFNS